MIDQTQCVQVRAVSPLSYLYQIQKQDRRYCPVDMESSYFSAQSLGWLGGAFNPLFTGGVLTSFPPDTLWLILIGVSAGAWLCMMRGLQISNAYR